MLNHETEKCFREYYFHDDRQAIRLASGFTLIAAALLSVADFTLLIDSPNFLLIYGLRICLSVLAGYLTVHAHRISNYLMLDRLVVTAVSIIILISVLINSSRPSDSIYYVFIDIVTLMLMYFILPVSFRTLLSLTFLFSMCNVVILTFNNPPTTNLLYWSIVLSYGVCNGFGMVFSRAIGSQKRIQFVVLKQEQKRYLELKENNENSERYTQLLSICSICKKVRDEEGYWDPIEHFLLKTLGIECSHGICPDCAQRHFSSYLPHGPFKPISDSNGSVS